MKNQQLVFLFVFFLFASVSQMEAQDFRFGFQVSPSWSWMTTDGTPVNPNGSVLGLKLGAVGEYYFRENYAFTGGLGFAFNSGGQLRYDNGGTVWTETLEAQFQSIPAGTTLKYNLQYVEIPMGLKMRTREFGYIRYFAEIPIITLGFESQARGTVEGIGVELEEKLNIKNEVNAIALSWGLGAGLEYGISTSTSLVGGLYFQKVFTDVLDDNGEITQSSGSSISNDLKETINAITLRLGVLF